MVERGGVHHVDRVAVRVRDDLVVDVVNCRSYSFAGHKTDMGRGENVRVTHSGSSMSRSGSVSKTSTAAARGGRRRARDESAGSNEPCPRRVDEQRVIGFPQIVAVTIPPGGGYESQVQE